MALYLGMETVSCQLLQLDAMMDVELNLKKLGNLFQFFCCMLRKIIAVNSALWWNLFDVVSFVAFCVWETKLADFKTELT